jgi:hypothetical protein
MISTELAQFTRTLMGSIAECGSGPRWTGFGYAAKQNGPVWFEIRPDLQKQNLINIKKLNYCHISIN